MHATAHLHSARTVVQHAVINDRQVDSDIVKLVETPHRFRWSGVKMWPLLIDQVTDHLHSIQRALTGARV